MNIGKYNLGVNAFVMIQYLKLEASNGNVEHVINHADIDRRNGISKHRQIQGLNELERKNLIIRVEDSDVERHKVFKINESKFV